MLRVVGLPVAHRCSTDALSLALHAEGGGWGCNGRWSEQAETECLKSSEVS
jgi:hypothetical protein